MRASAAQGFCRSRQPKGPLQTAFMEINHNQLLVSQESVALNASGWFESHKTDPIFEPNIGMVFY
jgi:hypothetical protein